MRRLRICSLFCTILFFFSTFSAWGAQGKVRSVSEGANWEEEAVETAAALTEEELEKKLFCSSAILMEQSTGKVLYEMNADTQMPPASITKIMTMLLLMERLDSGEISPYRYGNCSRTRLLYGGEAKFGWNQGNR